MGRLARYRRPKQVSSFSSSSSSSFSSSSLSPRERAQQERMNQPPSSFSSSSASASTSASTSASAAKTGKRRRRHFEDEGGDKEDEDERLPGKWRRMMEWQQQQQRPRPRQQKKQKTAKQQLLQETETMLRDMGENVLDPRASRSVSQRIDELSNVLVGDELQKTHRVSAKRKQYLAMRKERKRKRTSEGGGGEEERPATVAFGEVAQDIPHFTAVPTTRKERLKKTTVPAEARLLELERQRAIAQYRKLKSMSGTQTFGAMPLAQ